MGATQVGDRFGKLVVVEKRPSLHIIDKNGHHICRAKWLLRCDCGFEYEMTGTHFRERKLPMCKGCAYRARPQSTKINSDEERLFRKAVVSPAKARGISVEITAEDFIHIASQSCHYCGTPPRPREFIVTKTVYVGQRTSFTVHGLDRVDNSLGYTIDNCVSSCTTCNTMKMAIPVGEFLAHVKKIAAYSSTLISPQGREQEEKEYLPPHSLNDEHPCQGRSVHPQSTDIGDGVVPRNI